MTDEMKACPECAEQVKVQALLCRYCKYDFRTRTSGRVAPPVRPASTATKKKGFPVWAIVLIACGGCCVVVPVIAAIAIPGLLQAQRAANERTAVAALLMLESAEAEFRSNDRDGNGVRDFWTGDVAGLYSMTSAAEPGADDDTLQLIELSIAAADAEPLEEGAAGGEYGSFGGFISSRSGFLFQAIEADAEGEPYARDTDNKMGAVHNEYGFAFCAFPELYGPGGQSTYIINEDGVVWKADLGGEPLFRWPTEEDLELNWERVP